MKQIGDSIFSKQNNAWYKLCAGGGRTCKGCCFVDKEDNGIDDRCNCPSDIFNQVDCDGDNREDGQEIIFKRK